MNEGDPHDDVRVASAGRLSSSEKWLQPLIARTVAHLAQLSHATLESNRNGGSRQLFEEERTTALQQVQDRRRLTRVGGLHFRTACTDGLEQGGKIGKYAFKHFLQPVRTP